MAKIPTILEAGRADGKLIKTNSIYDDNQEKFLSDKIKEIDDNHNELNDKVEALTDIVNNNESDIETKLVQEKLRATNAESNLRETINNITEINENATSANIVTVDTIPNTSSSNVQQALNELFKNALFAGIATPATNPGTPDGPVFYIATTAGTYANFSGLSVGIGELAILKWDDTWNKQTITVSLPPNELNISNIYNTQGIGGTNKYTLDEAIAQVPIKYRVQGLKVSFINENGNTESWEYQGGSWKSYSFIPCGKDNAIDLQGTLATSKYNIKIYKNRTYRFTMISDEEEAAQVWLGDKSTSSETVVLRKGETKTITALNDYDIITIYRNNKNTLVRFEDLGDLSIANDALKNSQHRIINNYITWENGYIKATNKIGCSSSDEWEHFYAEVIPGDTITLYTLNSSGAYCLFLDSDNNIIGEPFLPNGIKTYSIPSNAKKIGISNWKMKLKYPWVYGGIILPETGKDIKDLLDFNSKMKNPYILFNNIFDNTIISGSYVDYVGTIKEKATAKRTDYIDIIGTEKLYISCPDGINSTIASFLVWFDKDKKFIEKWDYVEGDVASEKHFTNNSVIQVVKKAAYIMLNLAFSSQIIINNKLFIYISEKEPIVELPVVKAFEVPKEDEDLTNKKYVDEQITTKISAGLSFSKWEHLGDSISANADDEHLGWTRTWIQLLQEKYKFELTNRAKSGWAWVTPKDTNYKSFFVGAQNISENTDRISIMGGINDLIHKSSIRIGTIEEAESSDIDSIDPTNSDTCTTLMAVRKTLYYLRNKFLNKPIYVLLPIDYEEGSYGIDESRGTMAELREGIKYFSNKYGCRLIDNEEFQPSSKDIIPKLWYDGVHPNQDGQQLMANNLEIIFVK